MTLCTHCSPSGAATLADFSEALRTRNMHPLSSLRWILYCRAPAKEDPKSSISMCQTWPLTSPEDVLLSDTPLLDFDGLGGVTLVTGHGDETLSELCWPQSGGSKWRSGKRDVSKVTRKEKRPDPCGKLIGWSDDPSLWTSWTRWTFSPPSVLAERWGRSGEKKKEGLDEKGEKISRKEEP